MTRTHRTTETASGGTNFVPLTLGKEHRTRFPPSHGGWMREHKALINACVAVLNHPSDDVGDVSKSFSRVKKKERS
jgi:hypothetical protein